MGFNFYQVTKKIKGKDYTFQFNGLGTALKAFDSWYIDGTSNISLVKQGEYIFEHVLVSPKLSINDIGAENIGNETKKTINGVEYTAKFKGILEALKIVDKSYIDGSDNTSIEKLGANVFEKIITFPEKLTANDFKNMKEYSEVVSFGREVMQGGEDFELYNEIVAVGREVMQGNLFPDETENREPTKKGSKS